MAVVENTTIARMTLLAAILLAAVVLPVHAGQLHLGRGAAKITPAPGTPMGGGFTINLSTGVHDDLYCKAIALEKDGVRAALVACDVESLHRPTVLKARELIAKSCTTPPEHVMITATHSHSGPEMTPMVINGATGEPGKLIREFHESLPASISEAVKKAEADAQPALVHAGSEHEDRFCDSHRRVIADDPVGRRHRAAVQHCCLGVEIG